jgi:hypothetical protein
VRRATALLLLVLAAGLVAVAQSGGKQFVRPPAGQNPPYSPAIRAGNV